jgi:hypothetical protein
MPDTHEGTVGRVVVWVVRVPSLPEGRRVARLDRPGLVVFLVLEGEMSEETAEEFRDVMQDGLDCGIYDQHWGGASVKPPQAVPAS